MKLNHLLAILILLCFFANVFAQESSNKPIGFAAMVDYGEIIKHSPDFIAEINAQTTMVEIGVIRRSQHKHLWEFLHNHPQVGISFLYADFNQPRVFGKAYTVFPHIRFDFLKAQKSNAYFRLGTGVAYLNKPFDVLTNETNNIIGSKINNITQLKFGYDYQIARQWNAALGFGLTHFSNSSVRKPNLGINVVSGHVGLQYTPQSLGRSNQFGDLPAYNRSIRGHAHVGLAFTERLPAGGPTYLVYIINAGIQKQVSLKNKAGVGLEYEYNEEVHDFLVNQEIFEENTVWDASRLQVYLYDEFLFNKIGLSAQLGYYVHAPFTTSSSYTFKLGLHYYWLNHYEHTDQFYVAAYLKSHLSVAQYVEVGVGYVF